MATIEDLHAHIEAARRTLEERKQQTATLRDESNRAEERQKLRRQLEEVQKHISHQESINSGERNYRRLLDADALGSLPSEISRVPAEPATTRYVPGSTGEVVNCSETVAKGEYLWKIEGLSWLVNSLHQNETPYAESCSFVVGGEEFTLVYHPKAGEIGDLGGQKGSLAIVHQDEGGITFRYRALVKRADGEFIQWGEEGNECFPSESTCGRAFGPDVHMPVVDRPRSMGIFGLSHEQLLKSEWVVADSLTVKFELEVRPNVELDPFSLKKPYVEVPPSTLGANFLALLEDGKCSDVTFMVQGEPIKAHSQILAARSEVFERQLNNGMRESVSKEVVVDDCDGKTFKAMLQFLYSDDISFMEETVKKAGPADASNTRNYDNNQRANVSDHQIPLLQNILAVSHMYQVRRLRLWCEQRLCECISANDVFSVLCQAHLYEAQQLEMACLTFIKENMEKVFATPAFGRGTKEWPEVILKINHFLAGLADSKTAPAVQAQQEASKDGGSKRRRVE